MWNVFKELEILKLKRELDSIKKDIEKNEIDEKNSQEISLRLEKYIIPILINVNKFKINNYEKVREIKIKNGEIAVLKGVEIDLLNEKPNIFNFFGIGNKNIYKTPIFYFDKNSNIIPMKIDKPIGETIDILKEQKYIITPETQPKFYKGRRTLFLSSDYPINANFEVKNDKAFFWVDSKTFNTLINNVVNYKLTHPKNSFDLISFVKKYWWLIALLILFFVLLQNGSIQQFFKPK